MHFRFHFHYDIPTGIVTLLSVMFMFAFMGRYDVSATILIVTFVFLVVWALFTLLRGRL